MITTRLSKVVLSAGVGAFALLSGLTNVVDYETNWRFLQAVMAMETVGSDPDASWRAVTNPILQRTAYGLVIIFQFLTGAFFLAAAVDMAKNLTATRSRFRRAKGLVPVGASLGFLVWFVGFVVIGGEWFQMWRSEGWNGQPAAFFYYSTMLLVSAYVLLENDGDLSSQL